MIAKTLRVSVTFVSNEHDRRFIACVNGRHGRLATAAEVRDHYRVYGVASNADEALFEGYKGGDFQMDESTPVWVSNYGDAAHSGVVGIRDLEYMVIIDTAWCDY